MDLYDKNRKKLTLDLASGLISYIRNGKLCIEYDDETMEKLRKYEFIEQEVNEISEALADASFTVEAKTTSIVSEIRKVTKVE